MAADFQLFTSLRYDPSLLKVRDSALNQGGWNHANASPFYMLDFHRDRLLRAATHWGWDTAVEVLTGELGLERLAGSIMKFLGEDQKSPMRVKVVVSQDGTMTIEAGKVPGMALSNLYPRRLPRPGESPLSSGDESGRPPTVEPYEVVLDGAKTPASEYTHFKTTRREIYDRARQSAGINVTDKKEVLIIRVNDGAIMEGSITTPYFWRNGRWVTPAVSAKYNPKTGSGGQDGTTRRWALEKGLAFEETVLVDSLQDGEECWLSNGLRGFMYGRLSLDGPRR
ncbi:aminotransferase [Podospora didyma]|uniref:Aminotransferase n=1 Tax=Podospora didyma TaxID=330526 RepID=A0AAE0KKH4_9PEZI|nr:aminotransferase [Podospora didyma]